MYFPVHRLDQDTSGILIIAKNERAYSSLQHQFITHTIRKTYTALLDGIVEEDEGRISLPLRPDFDDRPRQMVDKLHGKRAVTDWRVIERKEGVTRVEFYPQTGRTHQLRMHAAHQEGLNAPILGDKLYGKQSDCKRLCLHASRIEFNDTQTNERICVESNSAF
jgi:tRNA pseudouridine32 synthase/23S rRNA pseudouridine746 synthase